MHDDDLQARLRDADPARRTPPPDPSWIDTLAQSTMEAPMTTPEPAAGTRRTWLLTAAAAVLVAALGVGGWSALSGDDNRDQVAREKTVTTLIVPKPDLAAMCMQLTPETVGQMQVAFDGTVSSIEGEEVTLDVTKWYVGGDTDQVKLVQNSPDAMIALEGDIQLEQGQRYLVTAHDGQVNGCGFTALWSQELQDIFDQAFAG